MEPKLKKSQIQSVRDMFPLLGAGSDASKADAQSPSSYAGEHQNQSHAFNTAAQSPSSNTGKDQYDATRLCAQFMQTLDISTMTIVVRYCTMSPSERHNGIAVCNRMWNIAWRKRNLDSVLRILVNRSATRSNSGSAVLNLADTLDVLGYDSRAVLSDSEWCFSVMLSHTTCHHSRA